VDKFIEDKRYTSILNNKKRHSPNFRIFTRQVRKQLAQYIERVSERGKKTRQTGEWVCIFTRQAEILLACGKLASGYPHLCLT
jgi:hypothetical protein